MIPANKKWFRNLAVSQIIVDALEELKMKYPVRQPEQRRAKRSRQRPEASHDSFGYGVQRPSLILALGTEYIPISALTAVYVY